MQELYTIDPLEWYSEGIYTASLNMKQSDFFEYFSVRFLITKAQSNPITKEFVYFLEICIWFEGCDCYKEDPIDEIIGCECLISRKLKNPKTFKDYFFSDIEDAKKAAWDYYLELIPGIKKYEPVKNI